MQDPSSPTACSAACSSWPSWQVIPCPGHRPSRDTGPHGTQVQLRFQQQHPIQPTLTRDPSSLLPSPSSPFPIRIPWQPPPSAQPCLWGVPGWGCCPSGPAPVADIPAPSPRWWRARAVGRWWMPPSRGTSGSSACIFEGALAGRPSRAPPRRWATTCPQKWLYYRGYCYGYFTERKTWAEAEVGAGTAGGHWWASPGEDGD